MDRIFEEQIDRRNEKGQKERRHYAMKLANEHRLQNKECHDGLKLMGLKYVRWFECTCGLKTDYFY